MRRKQRFGGACLSGLLLAFVCLNGAHAFGQAVFGTIFGTVTDASGAAIPKANVTITDTAKGTSVTLQTNESGDFTNEHLIPDPYVVKIEMQGFKSFQQTNIQVFADTSVKVQAAMEVGSTGETVNVAADQVPLLKTDRADVSTTFTSQEIIDLPVPDRNFTSLQLLLPGAQELGWSHAASEDPQGSKQIEVDGQAFAGVAFTLDGTDNQDPMLGIIVINPNADSLSETKITTQNFDAEFGKAVSSVVTAQTKSGTNSFHGSAFDYRKSSANLARDPFTQFTQASVPSAIKSQFGGSIGGPILKDKAFFFGDYQGTRQKVGTGNTQTIPTALLSSTCLGAVGPSGIAGCDFSDYTKLIPNDSPYYQSQQLIFRNTVNADGTISSTPYNKNVIPMSELSPQALAVVKLLSGYTPNNPGAGPTAGLAENFSKSGNGLFNANQWDVRGDYTFNQRVHAFGRFSRFTDILTGAVMFGDAGGAGFGIGGYGGTSRGANDSLAAGADVTLTDKLVTDFRLGYVRYNIKTSKYDQGTDFATTIGIPGLNTSNNFTSGAPGFQIQDAGSNFGSFPSQDQGSQYGASLNVNRCNCPLTEREDQYQVTNNWTKILGNHSVKFGADLRYARNLRVPSDNDRTGVLQFDSGPTSAPDNSLGLGMATFLTGKVTNFVRFVSTSTNAKEFQKRDFFYAQDTWRVTSKLTANLGLRYELYFPESVNGPGNGSLLNLDTGYLQVAGIGGIKSNMNYSPGWNTYSPRIGLAYQVNQGLVVRGGYGRSFDIGVFGSIFGHAATQNLPVLASQQISRVGGINQNFAFNLAQGPSAPIPVTVPSDGLLPNPGAAVSSHSRPDPLRLPTLDAWNLSLQQSFTPTLSVTIAYVGNKGTHTLGDQSGQQTNPNERAIFLPSQYSVTGNALHYDPAGGDCYPAGGNCVLGGLTGSDGKDISGTNLIPASGAVRAQDFLRRYYGGKLPACSDPDYATVGGVNAINGGCGWNNSIQYYGDNLDTHYNALQVTATKQMAHGYSLNANYAWQQAISETTGYSTWSRPAVRGRDGALRQQQIIVYGLLQLPFGKNKAFLNHTNRFINQVVSGFEISPVISYASGLPFTLNYSTCSANVSGDAPCYVSGNSRSFRKHLVGFPGTGGLSFYDKYNLTGGSSPFYTPTLDQIGNVGRNTAFGPNNFMTDLSVQKNFPIRERVSFQLRADGYNAFNHINFGLPNGNIDQGGQISNGPYPEGSRPRQMQFSARVQF